MRGLELIGYNKSKLCISDEYINFSLSEREKKAHYVSSRTFCLSLTLRFGTSLCTFTKHISPHLVKAGSLPGGAVVVAAITNVINNAKNSNISYNHVHYHCCLLLH